MKIGKYIIFLLSILTSVFFLLAGFSVGLDPRSWPHLVLFSMTFPVSIIAMFIMTFISDVINCRNALLVLIMSWILGFRNVCCYSPFNFHSDTDEIDKTETICIMTYNAFRFQPDNSTKDLDYNVTLSSIINSGADIVAIQESMPLDVANPRLNITREQCDSLKSIFSHSICSGDGMTLLSKYPFEELSLEGTPEGSARFAAYRIHFPFGDCCFFNLHLQSFQLNDSERAIYREITDGDVTKQVLSEARNDIIPKVKSALISHAYEAEMLASDINRIAPTGMVIVCGDFNDILGSYPVKYLCRECDLQDSYRTGAFGPTYTYHRSRFYFNIDHILYRGFGRPLKTWCEKVAASDHYPLLTILPIERHK